MVSFNRLQSPCKTQCPVLYPWAMTWQTVLSSVHDCLLVNLELPTDSGLLELRGHISELPEGFRASNLRNSMFAFRICSHIMLDKGHNNCNTSFCCCYWTLDIGYVTEDIKYCMPYLTWGAVSQRNSCMSLYLFSINQHLIPVLYFLLSWYNPKSKKSLDSEEKRSLL